jgi:hypothetical protein
VARFILGATAREPFKVMTDLAVRSEYQQIALLPAEKWLEQDLVYKSVL